MAAHFLFLELPRGKVSGGLSCGQNIVGVCFDGNTIILESCQAEEEFSGVVCRQVSGGQKWGLSDKLIVDTN